MLLQFQNMINNLLSNECLENYMCMHHVFVLWEHHIIQSLWLNVTYPSLFTLYLASRFYKDNLISTAAFFCFHSWLILLAISCKNISHHMCCPNLNTVLSPEFCLLQANFKREIQCITLIQSATNDVWQENQQLAPIIISIKQPYMYMYSNCCKMRIKRVNLNWQMAIKVII